MKIQTLRFSTHHFSLHQGRLWLGGVAVAASFLLPLAVRAEQADPGEQPAAVSNDLSPEGRQLLAVTALLAGSLVGMERFCSWRLGVRQRRALTARQFWCAVPSPSLPVALAAPCSVV